MRQHEDKMADLFRQFADAVLLGNRSRHKYYNEIGMWMDLIDATNKAAPAGHKPLTPDEIKEKRFRAIDEAIARGKKAH